MRYNTWEMREAITTLRERAQRDPRDAQTLPPIQYAPLRVHEREMARLRKRPDRYQRYAGTFEQGRAALRSQSREGDHVSLSLSEQRPCNNRIALRRTRVAKYRMSRIDGCPLAR